jgi:hypothetical protein
VKARVRDARAVWMLGGSAVDHDPADSVPASRVHDRRRPHTNSVPDGVKIGSDIRTIPTRSSVRWWNV